jgi:GPI-anchor transamidase subunit GAA1
VYRINTFPFIHLNFIHALLNVLALTPLMERFEHEHGTLTVVALFVGRELPYYPLLQAQTDRPQP